MSVNARNVAHPTDSMFRRIARNSMLLAGGTAVSSVLTMLAVVVAARGLGKRDFGVLVLMQSSVLMLGAIISASTQQPVIKLGSDAQAANDKDRLGEVVSMALVVDIAAAVLSLAVALFVIEVCRRVIGLADRNVVSAWIVAVSLLFSSFPSSNGIFRLYDRFGLLTLVQSASALALLSAYGVLFAIGGDLQAYVAAWAAYCAISGVVQLGASLALLRSDGVPIRFRRGMFSNPDGRVLLHYSWTTWGASTTDGIRTSGDSLLVGALVSIEAAALYNIARQLAGLVRKLTIVYTSTVFPEIARLSARGDAAGARTLRRRMFWIGLVIAAAGTGLAVLFGRVVIRFLFGLPFEPAYVALIILTAAASSQLISQTPYMYVQVYRGPRLALLLQTIATIAFLVVAVPLAYAFSMDGMAASQLIFGIVLTLLSDLALSQAQGVSPSQTMPDHVRAAAVAPSEE
jgi:O-antigen/teichoic acid export membrane protein